MHRAASPAVSASPRRSKEAEIPYASTAQQRMFNARAATGDPKWVALARDFNEKTYGRPGWTPGGARTGAKGTTRGGPAKYARLPTHVPRKKTATERLAQRLAQQRRSRGQ